MKKNLATVTSITFMFIMSMILISCKAQAKQTPKPERTFTNANILIEDYCNGMLQENFDGDTIVFSVYKDGKLKDSVKAKKLIKNINMEDNKIGDHYFIGYILSVFDDGLIIDSFSELLWYDFKSKEFHSSSEAEIATKINKLCLQELNDLLSGALPLIQDEKDRKMLSDVQASTHSDSDGKLTYKYNHANSKLAHGNMTKASYFYKTDSTHINIFILDEDSSLLVDIFGGGDKKAMEEQGLTTYDYDPSRCYRFYPKTGELSVSDFYWE